MKRKDMSPRLVLIRQIVVGFLLVLLFTALGFGVWYGSRIQSLTITSVTVVGGETIAHTAIQEVAQRELEGVYYRLIPKRFAWLYPKEKIATKIREIDRIKNVHVDGVSGTEIAIAFEEYRPFALWCENIHSKDCLFMDADGYAFSAAPRLEGAAFIRFSERGRIPEQFVYAFDEAFMERSNAFVERAYNDLNLNIIHIEKTSEDDMTYYIAGGGELKVALNVSVEETIDNLRTILTSVEFEHIAPGNFQYIDLRYGNKIFVNEEDPNAPAATSTQNTTNSRNVSSE